MNNGRAERPTRWAFILFLAAINMLAFMDRQVFALMIPAIQADIALSDFHLGLIGGLAFALVFSLFSFPLAWLADRFSRKGVIVGGLLFWSLMMAISGLARGFATLFAARMGVGAGEAALTPAAHSLIRSVTKPNDLSRAMALFGAGSAIGLGLAYLLGGQIYTLFAGFGDPDVLGLAPWQWVFISFAFPGLVLGVWLSRLKSPPKSVDETTPANQLPAWHPTGNGPLILLFAGIGCFSTAIHAFNTWLPAHFIRAFDWSIGDVGTTFSIIVVIGGLAGMFGTGWIGDRHFAKKGAPEALPIFMAIAALFAIPVLGLAALWPQAWMTIVVLFPAVTLTAVPAVLGPTLVQVIAPLDQRARYSAIYLISYTLIGSAFGPALVGLVSDSGIGLANAISVVASTGLVFAAGLFWLAARKFTSR